ncbi:uncharacterized protein METZ01_LOCUS460763, partial [marine metagenome]
MGGTLRKLSVKNHDIKVVFLATGIAARRSDKFRNETKYEINKTLIKKMEEQIKKLRLDAKRALKILGIKNIEFFDFPDNEMDMVSN